jgi:hypothetical protein
MPVITATRAGLCAAVGCTLRIRRGEMIVYEAATGARHLECAAARVGRRNEKTTSCRLCGRELGPGRAVLQLEEHGEGAGRTKKWLATCAEGCERT